MTRYREAFTWTRTIDDFIRWEIRETPILNACAGRSAWGDVTLDLHEPADVQGCWTSLPFDHDSFGAVFADPPWDSGHKTEVADERTRQLSLLDDTWCARPPAAILAP
jgi:hypothetical protein